MNTIETLKLAQGAVSTKRIVEALSCLHFYHGRVQGGDGKLAVDAPIKGFPDMTVSADVVKTLASLEGKFTLELQDSRLLVWSGDKKFDTWEQVSGDYYPKAERPSGDFVPIPDDFFPAVSRIDSFISDDASRPWSMSVLIRDGFVYASNNVVLARTDLEGALPEMTIPSFALEALRKIPATLQSVHIADNRLVFAFEGDIFVETRRYADPWPKVEGLIHDDAEWTALPADFCQHVELVANRAPDSRLPVVKIGTEEITTLRNKARGGRWRLEEQLTDKDVAFHAHPLLAVLRVATHVDFTPYPRPCPFKGGRIQGIITGVVL